MREPLPPNQIQGTVHLADDIAIIEWRGRTPTGVDVKTIAGEHIGAIARHARDGLIELIVDYRHAVHGGKIRESDLRFSNVREENGNESTYTTNHPL